jgi:hypothetical protein
VGVGQKSMIGKNPGGRALRLEIVIKVQKKVRGQKSNIGKIPFADLASVSRHVYFDQINALSA